MAFYTNFATEFFHTVFTRIFLLRQDPLDLSFWSFLTFLHHGIECIPEKGSTRNKDHHHAGGGGGSTRNKDHLTWGRGWGILVFSIAIGQGSWTCNFFFFEYLYRLVCRLSSSTLKNVCYALRPYAFLLFQTLLGSYVYKIVSCCTGCSFDRWVILIPDDTRQGGGGGVFFKFAHFWREEG